MKTIQEIGILVTTSIIAAIAVNYFSPAGIALVGQWDTAKGVITANEKSDIVFLIQAFDRFGLGGDHHKKITGYKIWQNMKKNLLVPAKAVLT